MMNYNEELTNILVAEYRAGCSIPELAKKFNKSEKSIVGKLAREGVYVKKVYKSKTGEIPETKKEIIARLAVRLRLDPERIQGLEKAPKIELKLIEASLK